MTQATEKKAQRPLLRSIQGVVASDKGNKTIKVVVEYQTRHPKYGKFLKRRTVLHAHDEKNEAQPGDKVEIVETRPLSARKHHALARIIEKPKLREDSLTATKADEPVKKTKTPAEASEAKPVTKSQNKKDTIISDTPKEGTE